MARQLLRLIVEYTTVSPTEFADLAGLDEWRFALGAIRAAFGAESYPAAAAFVVAVTEAAERLDHHPDIDIRYPGTVHVALTTHATGGLTSLDVDLAREISRIAAEAGLPTSGTEIQEVELCIDTLDADRIRPFWTAVLDAEVADDGSLFDRRRRGWSVWFQQMDEPREQRNRLHLDVTVPHDAADARIAAAIAAGGTLLSDREARAFWILADADGNEACVCTWQDR